MSYNNIIDKSICYKCNNKKTEEEIINDDNLKEIKLFCKNENCEYEYKKKKYIEKSKLLLNFGKFKFERIFNVIKNDKKYIEWVLKVNENNKNIAVVNKNKTIKFLLDNFNEFSKYVE